MMVLVPVTILGGLPVIADVWFSGPDYYGEYDCGVDALFWQRANGAPGKEVSQTIYDRCDQRDDYWQADVTEQANDWLGAHCPIRIRDHAAVGGYRLEGDWSDEYIKLNGDPRQRASGMRAGTAKTPKAVEGEARQPGCEAGRPNTPISTPLNQEGKA